MTNTPIMGLAALTEWNGHPKGSAGYRRILASLACAGVATFAQLYSTQAVLPLISASLGVPAAQAALTISFATAGLAAAVLPWSFLADRIGRVRAMAFAIVTATVLGLLVPLAPTLPALLALRLLEGMALGGIPAIAIAFLNEEVSRIHTALAAGSYVAGTTLGGLAGRLVAGPVGDIWGWRSAALAVSAMATTAAVLFVVLVPKPRGFTPSRGSGFLTALSTLTAQARNPRLLALYVQAFLLMGSFVAVYNYLGFRLAGEPFHLPATAVSLIFLAYLSGTVSSRWGAALTERWGRRRVMVAATVAMAGGILLTLADSLAAVLTGLVVFTAGFFAAHSIGSGWTGEIASAGRAQAASLYNLAYYLGSSILGWAAGLLFQTAGWTPLAWTVATLAGVTALMAAVVLRGPADSRKPGKPARAR